MLTKLLRVELDDCLKALRLSSLREIYDKEADDMSREGLSYQEYLLQLLRIECDNRRNKRIERNLKISKIPYEKTLFDYATLGGDAGYIGSAGYARRKHPGNE